jgi:hypothetical protein
MAMAEARWKIRVVIVGTTDDSLRALLQDVLEVELLEGAPNPELVLAVVGPRDPFRVLVAAQVAARHQAPIIAILPFDDERLSRRALVAGARFCWPLDGSLQRLRSAFLGAIPRSTGEQR